MVLNCCDVYNENRNYLFSKTTHFTKKISDNTESDTSSTNTKQIMRDSKI